MYSIKVGSKYSGNIKQEGIRLNYSGGFNLEIILADLTTKEIMDIKFGKYSFGLTLMEDILFFTCGLGKSIEISDAPFHFGLYTDDRINDLPKTVIEGEGLALNITAIDSRTGIVKALRVIGLSTDFSRELIRICLFQSKMEVSSQKYDRLLTNIQGSYSSQEIYEKTLFKYCN